MIEPLIKLKQLRKVYQSCGLETHALVDISLSIAEGEFVSIQGPSGCGKSSLLSIMGLLDTLSSGRYFLEGRDVTTLSEKELVWLRNRQIGFVFQSFNLIDELTVAENIELPLVYGGVAKRERRVRVSEVLEQVRMLHREAYLPSQLSGGQQQRVAIARALVTTPRVLLADEPTGNLDSESGEEIMRLLGSLHDSGVTICMVTHDERHGAYASRVIHMLDGHIIDENCIE